MFIEESRGLPAQQLLGAGFERGLPFEIQFFLTWLTFGLIGIGVIAASFAHILPDNYKFQINYCFSFKNYFGNEFMLFSIICSGLAFAILIVPYISLGYGIERAYSLLLIYLSVFFVIGGCTLGNLALAMKSFITSKRGNTNNYNTYLAYIFILIVLIPYFLSITGMVHQALGVSYSVILNSEGEQYYSSYNHDTDSSNFYWQTYFCNRDYNLYQAHKFFHGSIGKEIGIELNNYYIFFLYYDTYVFKSFIDPYKFYNLIYSNKDSSILMN
jgi:uncharacterized membrane protein